jgi:hypothetical protein
MDDFDRELDDFVLFELPTYEGMEAFCERLRPRWEGWSDADEDGWLVSAELNGGDLAELLREAQELIAKLGHDSIRFCLDGRLYVLEAGRLGAAADLSFRSK